MAIGGSIGLGSTAKAGLVTKGLGNILYYKLGGAVLPLALTSSAGFIAAGVLIIVGAVGLSKLGSEERADVEAGALQ